MASKAQTLHCASTGDSPTLTWSFAKFPADSNCAPTAYFSSHILLRPRNQLFRAAMGVLTYLVNELRSAERTTPYSMVTATEIAGLREDEIIINSWLADDLGAKVGDELALKYFVVAGQRNLKEESRTFRISEIKPLESPDTSWTPPFPGVSDVENCRDWDPEFPSTRAAFGLRTRITGINSAAHRRHSSASRQASRCGAIASEI